MDVDITRKVSCPQNLLSSAVLFDFEAKWYTWGLSSLLRYLEKGNGFSHAKFEHN